MKAVFILPNLSAGGAERVVTLLSRMLVKRGIPVDILQFLSDKVQYDIPAGVQVISMNTQRLPLMKRVDTLRTYFREQCRQSPEVIAMPFHDSCYMFTISIENAKFTFLEKKTLTVHIIVEIFVFVPANMIRLQIGKYTNIKNKACYTVHHKSL